MFSKNEARRELLVHPFISFWINNQEQEIIKQYVNEAIDAVTFDDYNKTAPELMERALTLPSIPLGDNDELITIYSCHIRDNSLYVRYIYHLLISTKWFQSVYKFCSYYTISVKTCMSLVIHQHTHVQTAIVEERIRGDVKKNNIPKLLEAGCSMKNILSVIKMQSNNSKYISNYINFVSRPFLAAIKHADGPIGRLTWDAWHIIEEFIVQ